MKGYRIHKSELNSIFLRLIARKLGLEDELTQALYALQAEYPYIKLSELKRIYNTVCICRQIGEL